MIEEHVERVSDAFAHSPKKTVRRASPELAIPVMSVWIILRRYNYALIVCSCYKF